EEDHFAAGFPHGFERSVSVFINRIDPAFSPPMNAFFLDELREFHCSFLTDERIVVVEFDGVDAVRMNQVFNVLEDKRRGFAFPTGIINGYYGAKRACERATHTGMISCRSLAQKCFAEV